MQRGNRDLNEKFGFVRLTNLRIIIWRKKRRESQQFQKGSTNRYNKNSSSPKFVLFSPFKRCYMILHGIYKVFTWFTSFTVYVGDIFYDISDLHVERSKHG